MTREMESSNELGTGITTALAHEIKNPAAVAMAHVNLLRRILEETPDSLEIAETPEISESPQNPLCHHLNHIEQSLLDICDLVQDMLTAVYSPLEPYEIDIYYVLAEILDTYRAAWPGISFSMTANPPLTCLGQESTLRMIFTNLLKNAVEAVEHGNDIQGHITIRAAHREQDRNFLTVTICDNAPFDGNHGEKLYGNGLGLAICRHLLKQLGGKLHISQSKGGGWVATVILP